MSTKLLYEVISKLPVTDPCGFPPVAPVLFIQDYRNRVVGAHVPDCALQGKVLPCPSVPDYSCHVMRGFCHVTPVAVEYLVVVVGVSVSWGERHNWQCWEWGSGMWCWGSNPQEVSTTGILELGF